MFKLTENRKRNILITLSLIAGCWCNVINGLSISLSIYTGAIKNIYDLQQTEMELITASFNIGSGLGFLPGFCLDVYGPGVTNIIGVSLFSVGSFLMSVSFYVGSSYNYVMSSGVLAFYFFLSGLGSNYSYTTSICVNILNFKPKHRAMVQALLNVFYCASPMFYAPMFKKWNDIAVIMGGPQNFSGSYYIFSFSLFLAVFGTLGCAANVIACRRVMFLDEDEVKNDLSNEDGQCKTFFKEGASKEYLHILVIQVIMQGVTVMMLGNISTISASLKLSEYDLIYFIVLPSAFSILVHCIIGPASDWLKVPGSRSIMWLACLVFLFIGLLCVVCGAKTGHQGIPWIIICACCSQISLAGSIFFVVIITENFSQNVLGTLIGTGIFIYNLLGFLLQYIFGKMYDSMIDLRHSHNCFGTKCFKYSLIISIFLTAVAIGFGVALVYNRVTSAKKPEEPKMQIVQ